MLIAHLPAGYLLSKIMKPALVDRNCIVIAIIFSILPDIDLLYFYLIDNEQHLHHTYWTHIPFWWGFIWAMLFPLCKGKYLAYLNLAFGCLMLHMVLDTHGGGIAWLYPFSKELIYLITVPRIFNNTYISYILHWSFIFELLIVGIAAKIAWRDWSKYCER